MDQGKGWPEVLRFEWFCGHDIAPLVERRAVTCPGQNIGWTFSQKRGWTDDGHLQFIDLDEPFIEPY